jgi:hypothetical protein
MKQKAEKAKMEFLRFPVISQGAEHLVQGYLMRRNILTFKAPINNEGYDLICIHPDPRMTGQPVRVQVKSRYATDCPREFPLTTKSLNAFDFLIVAFLNVGYYHKERLEPPAGLIAPEFYTFPASFIRENHDHTTSWPKVRLRGMKLDRYRNELGFDLIAKKLGIPYPTRHQ